MTRSAPMVIRIKKGADGRRSLSCTRADGTSTWQRQEGAQASFPPRHDLTYCEENDLPAPEEFTEESLSLVRQKRGELFAQWEAVEPGAALELLFDPAAPAPYVAR